LRKIDQSYKKARLIQTSHVIHGPPSHYLVDSQSEVVLQMKKLVDLDPSMPRPFLIHAPAHDHVIKAGLLMTLRGFRVIV
jgi:hypothetical protein